MVSIIIRARNESKWIGLVLSAIKEQTFTDYEIVLVDNGSTDGTIEIAQDRGVDKVLSIDNFSPGKAINLGCSNSSGHLFVMLSAHCVPASKDWLAHLVAGFATDESVAGVYGRQLPVDQTPDVDFRDLIYMFGVEERLQKKDNFFHNANSCIRRDVWSKMKFDENVSNIEDRVWGQRIIEHGFSIFYEPKAAVYHYHGLHQSNKNSERVNGVVSVLRGLGNFPAPEEFQNLAISQNRTIALIMSDQITSSAGLNRLIEIAERCVEKADLFYKVVIVTPDDITLPDAISLNFRSLDIKTSDDLITVLEKIAPVLFTICKFDSLLYINPDYENHEDNIWTNIVATGATKRLDSVFFGLEDFGHYWIKNDADEAYSRVSSSLSKREYRNPVLKALYGLGWYISRTAIEGGYILSGQTEILQTENRHLMKRSFRDGITS